MKSRCGNMKVYLCMWIISCIIDCYGDEAEVLSVNSVLYATSDEALDITCKINTTHELREVFFFRNGKSLENSLLVRNGNCIPAIFKCDHTKKQFTYTLKPGDFRNGNTWFCRANSNGKDSKTVNITVVEHFSSITMTEPIGNRTTIDVSTVGLFKCETSLSRPVAEILWYKLLENGTEIQFLNDTVTEVMQNASMSWTKSTLQYTAAKRDNEASIVCKGFLSQVPGDIYTKSKEIQLNVQYPPTDEPQTNNSGFLTVLEGLTINILCYISGGNPIATLSWNCSGQSYSESINYNKTMFLSEVSLTANSDFNGASCYCIASHLLFPSKHVQTTINILFPPVKHITITTSYVEYINAGSILTLNCEIHGGNPVANATWTCDDLELSSVKTDFADNVLATTTFQVEKKDNRRNCTCTANHFIWIQKMQKHITLNVHFAPDTDLKITGATNQTIFYENDPVVLLCTLGNGNPLAKLTFQCWTSNTGTDSSNSTTTVSLISSTAMRFYNQKICKCSAEHKLLLKTLEHVIQTIVYYPPMEPHLSFSPSQPLLEGQEADVSCNAIDGNPHISSYKWTLNNASVGANNKILKLSNITYITNQQSLKCRVNNAFTDAKNMVVESNSETLNVHYRPRISNLNETLTTNEEMTVNISCIATGNPSPSVQWFHENYPVSEECTARSDMNLIEISRKQQGHYLCKANAISIHGNLESRATVNIIVNYPPDVSVLVEGNDLSVDSSVILYCNAAGQPDRYTFRGWGHSFNGIEIRNTEILQSNRNGSFIVLSKLSYQDTGTYSCFVDNGIRNRNGHLTQTNSTFIAVTGFPIKIPETPSNSIFTAEQRSLLTANLQFFTFPNVTELQWYNATSGNVVSSTFVRTNFSKTTLTYMFYDKKVNVNNFAYEALFMIQNFQHYQEGSYTLVVSNGYRIANFTFRAQISGPPESPVFVNISEKTDSEVTVYLISGFNGGHDQHFHVVYHEMNHDDFNNERSFNDSKLPTQSFRIGALKASTMYVFSVYASNEKGNSTINETLCCRILGVQTDAKPEEHLNRQVVQMTGIAAGVAGAVAVLIFLIIIVIFVKRRMPLYSKGKEENKSLNLTSSATDVEDEDGLRDNILYESAGPEFGRKNVSCDTVYAMVQKKGQQFKSIEEQNLQETGLCLDVIKKNNVKKTGAKKGKDKCEDKGKNNNFGNEDMYQNMSYRMKINGKDKLVQTNKNKDGLQYAELVFNPMPNGAKFVIHGIEDRTIYADVDTTQKIDPLPDSDDDDEQSPASEKTKD